MVVFRDHKIRFSGDGAVAEFIIVRVIGDYSETELRLDLANVTMKLSESFQQCHNIPPAFCAGKFDCNFFVFEKDFRGNSECQTAIEQSAENRLERLIPAKNLQKDVGVEADRHA